MLVKLKLHLYDCNIVFGKEIGVIMMVVNDNTEPAVLVQRACLSYGTSQILNNLNLTVPQNQIYGLLGPSGCGKTTLLNCIVGRLKLDSGGIFTKIKTTSELGYMPQDLALHGELSIREIFRYYGKMFDMTEEKINERSQELLQFLELHSDSKVITSLSGGQQRRVSLAVALFHDPQLLILDEPTVGLDPVLSQKIWEKLVEMAALGKTIIITTHYIEEAKQAHMIGMMRKGALLAEATPAELLVTYNCNYLEDAFLEMCQQQDTINRDQEGPFNYSPAIIDSSRKQKPLKRKDGFFTNSFKSQYMKNLFVLRRNWAATLFTVFLPIVQMAFFNYACGHDPHNLHLAIVNDEFLTYGSSSCDFDPMDTCILDNNDTHSVSCRYLDKLKNRGGDLGNTFKLVNFKSLEDAKTAVKRNDAWGVVHIPQNFSVFMSERLSRKAVNTNNMILDGSMIDVSIDMSDNIIGHLIGRELVKTFADSVTDLLTGCDAVDSKYAGIPIKFNDAIFGEYEMPFVYYSSPALLCLVTFYMPAICIGSRLMSEKEGGIIERTLAAGVRTKEILLAHIAIEFGFLCVQIVSLIVVVYGIFNNIFVGDGHWIVLLLVLIGFNGMLFGLLLAISCSSHIDAAFFCINSNFLLQFLCGLLWPIEGMHSSLKVLSKFLPLTLPVEAYRALSIRGWGITNRVVYSGFLSTTTWTFIFIGALVLTCKYKRNVWVGKQ